MKDIAIRVDHLSKVYKLYHKPSDRLKETLGMKVPVREHYALDDVSFDVYRGETVGIIGTDESVGRYSSGIIKSIGTRSDEESIGRHLYSVLREFDDCGAAYIFSESFDTPKMGQAIMNRLLKAAGHQVIKV